jgi:hypothetical protein
MDFWNDDIVFVIYKKWKMQIKKWSHSSVKNKINHHPMKNLRIRCIETFLIQENFIYKT